MNVFVVARSAPGGEVRVVDLGDDVRLRDVEEIRVALDVASVIAEPLAAVVRLGEPLPVDEHAPRAVVDGDSPVENLSRFDPLRSLVSLWAASHLWSGPDRAWRGAL